MKKRRPTYSLILLFLLGILLAGSTDACAQKARQRRLGIRTDSLGMAQRDSLIQAGQRLTNDTLRPNRTLLPHARRERMQRLNEQERLAQLEAPVDTAALIRANDSIQRNLPIEKKPRFVPNANRAVWLALVFPGGGQIYNRKYWKLPIVYGGFVGCAYALAWNNRMYKDYSQAYLDIMDDDPNTNSYEDFLPPGYDATGMEDTFKRRKDFYRRNRDLSIFCFIGVYMLSIIDAYVDAELSDFDISKDLGLHIQPVIFNDGRSRMPNTVGLQCSFKF